MKYPWIRIALCSALSISLLSLNCVNAAEAVGEKVVDQKVFTQNLAASGITFEQKNNKLIVNVDQSKALSIIPRLQTLGLLNKSITAKVITDKPISTTFKVGILFTTAIIDNEYRINKKIDKIQVNGYFIGADQKKEPCYAFEFSRDLYNKLDWNTLTDRDFVKAAPNFVLSEWCHAKLSAELKASGELEKMEKKQAS